MAGFFRLAGQVILISVAFFAVFGVLRALWRRRRAADSMLRAVDARKVSGEAMRMDLSLSTPRNVVAGERFDLGWMGVWEAERDMPEGAVSVPCRRVDEAGK